MSGQLHTYIRNKKYSFSKKRKIAFKTRKRGSYPIIYFDFLKKFSIVENYFYNSLWSLNF